MQFHWAADEVRVRKAVQGDLHATRRLVEDHYPELVRFLIHLTGRTEEAEEIAQETFVRAWQRLETFRGRSAFKTWIHQIAYREFLAHRANRAAVATPIGEDGATPDFVDDLLGRLDVERAILTLPADLRVTFLLFFVQGLSAAEVGVILDVPRGTVLSRLANARERLARRVQGRPTGERDPKPREGATPYEIASNLP